MGDCRECVRPDGVDAELEDACPMLDKIWNMAGAAGFEPTHGRIKTCCLTAWRRPCRCCDECLAFTYRFLQPANVANRAEPVRVRCENERKYTRTLRIWEALFK